MKHGQSLAALGLAGAAFFLLGSWKGSALLAVVVVVAAVLVLLAWLFKRRRQDSGAASLFAPPAAPEASASDLGSTQIEGLSGNAEPLPASASPGLHGKIEVQVNGQVLSTYLVTDNPLPIGRDPAQSLVIIQEPIVSKLHCQIFVRSGQVFVKDCQSTNGVYVRDEKVSEREIQDKDEVFLGKKGTVRIVYHR